MSEELPTARRTLYTGIVTRNDDPLKIGRVKVRIAGLIEPESGWCFPLASAGGGEDGLGFYAVPKRGAEVGVWFLQGDTDVPFYVPAQWGAPGGNSQAPTPVRDATPAEAPEIRCFETPRFLLVFDDRPGRESFEIRDKVSGDGVAYDGLQRALRVKATTAVVIEATGAVKIDGLAVTIAGRPVIPGNGPI